MPDVAVDLIADELRQLALVAPADSGSDATKRSLSRMTPILKLRANFIRGRVPSVISTLPPPMSITTAGFGVSTP